MPSDFPGAFAALREIMRRHSDGMIIQSDTPTDFTVITPAIGPNKKPIWFGAVMLKKSAVTYHIFPLYFNPAMQAAVPLELLKRKQGKTCFNFQRPDPELFAELDKLTALGRRNFERHGLLKPGPVAYEQLEAMFKAAGGDPEALAKRRKKMAKQAAEKRAATIAKKKKPAKSAAAKKKGK
jgi:hypothetical protein